MNDLLEPLLVSVDPRVSILVFQDTILKLKALRFINLDLQTDAKLVCFESMDLHDLLDAVRQRKVGNLFAEVSLSKPSEIQDIAYQERLGVST